jgi:hypothetical protein
VLFILSNVHIPLDARTLLPVDVEFASLKVSVVIAIVVETPDPLTSTIDVPIGNATVPFAGIVCVVPDDVA